MSYYSIVNYSNGDEGFSSKIMRVGCTHEEELQPCLHMYVKKKPSPVLPYGSVTNLTSPPSENSRYSTLKAFHVPKNWLSFGAISQTTSN